MLLPQGLTHFFTEFQILPAVTLIFDCTTLPLIMMIPFASLIIITLTTAVGGRPSATISLDPPKYLLQSLLIPSPKHPITKPHLFKKFPSNRPLTTTASPPVHCLKGVPGTSPTLHYPIDTPIQNLYPITVFGFFLGNLI
jgi:hypothetical protein